MKWEGIQGWFGVDGVGHGELSLTWRPHWEGAACVPSLWVSFTANGLGQSWIDQAPCDRLPESRDYPPVIFRVVTGYLKCCTAEIGEIDQLSPPVPSDNGFQNRQGGESLQSRASVENRQYNLLSLRPSILQRLRSHAPIFRNISHFLARRINPSSGIVQALENRIHFHLITLVVVVAWLTRIMSYPFTPRPRSPLSSRQTRGTVRK